MYSTTSRPFINFLCVRHSLTLSCSFALLWLTGCAGDKAFLHLPPEQQRQVRFLSRSDHQPDVRFLSIGASAAREAGGIIGLTVGHSLERSSSVLKQVRKFNGPFEVKLIEEQFVAKLRAAGVSLNDSGNPRLELIVRWIGLREMERGRFAASAAATTRLFRSDGQEIWSARAQSTAAETHSLQEFAEHPELYRRGFDEVAADLAVQLVEGPVREIRF